MVIDSTRFLTLMLVGLQEDPGNVPNVLFYPDIFSIVLSKWPSIMKSGPRALFGQLLKLKMPRSPPTPDPSTQSEAGEREEE
jgi:hypothetical protein